MSPKFVTDCECGNTLSVMPPMDDEENNRSGVWIQCRCGKRNFAPPDGIGRQHLRGCPWFIPRTKDKEANT